MTKIMMKLGQYKFSLSTAAYQELKRTSPHRWSEQNRVGRRPALQYTGPGKETVELSGDIYTTYKGGTGQLDAMRKEASTGQPMILVDGLGKIWGKWCIEEVQETQTIFLPGGIPKKQTFNLRLSHYGEDK
ncbi:MAG: phage tail protein [Desulfobacteraceae bacterium]|nr:phage tail protein [Desulfobacteraceae bacterium]